jgi:hypothetical protein
MSGIRNYNINGDRHISNYHTITTIPSMLCFVRKRKKTRTKYPNIYMNMRYSFMHRADTKGVIRSHNSMKNKPDNVKRKGTKRQTMVNKIHESNTNWYRYQGADK